FVWELGHGYNEWTQGEWSTFSIEPDTWIDVGYSRPENLSFTATLVASTGLEVDVVYHYEKHAVVIERAEHSG
ncbi:MAG TPA: hypothetical protein VGP93_10455, partial [Polyangiaceae bacterium]|nr:hypothetical protein [Polyangiaceae bacterium]